MSIIAAGTTTTTALSSTGNTDGTLQLQVNGTTPSVTLNTLGAIGVGSTPNYGTAGQALLSNGSTSAAYWGSPSAGAAGSNTQIQYNNSGVLGASSALTFDGTNLALTQSGNPTMTVKTTGAGNNPLYRLQADTNYWEMLGVFSDSNDTLRLRYNGSDKLVMNNSGAVVLAGGDSDANGVGIVFPATQSASTNANTLDDYEEGTWTPGLTSTGGNFTGLSVSGAGTYTKTGRMVVVRGAINTSSSFSGGSGGVIISGLPFATAAAVFVGGIHTSDNSGVFNQPSALATLVLASGTGLEIYKNGSVANNAFATTNLNTSAGNGNPFAFTCTYFV